MICPLCGSESHVIESRNTVNKVGRKHFCPRCQSCFYTVEIHATREDFRDIAKTYEKKRRQQRD